MLINQNSLKELGTFTDKLNLRFLREGE